MTAVVKQVSAQECPSVTGIPFIDNLNCQVCGVACGTNPANEQFKDSTYLPALSEEELWDMK